MRFRMARLMVSSAAAVLALAIATPSAAQVSTGRIDASIVDSTGAVLPGVTVDISGPQDHTAVTDPLGEVHFLNLAPGTYTVSAKLSGFSDYLNKTVPVGTGASVPLKMTRPPCSPAPSPMSTTMSATRIMSASCSTTRTVLP